MSEEQDARFQRAYQAGVTDVARMYATALTVMEIELGTEATRRLAPQYLGDIVAAGERIALRQMESELRRSLLDDETPPEADVLTVGESEAAARRRVQLTIEDALDGSAPW